MAPRNPDRLLDEAREDYLAQWGALGSAWGVNRTMSRIHALLMVSADPLSTDDIMERLDISRGNAHTQLKTLTGWGLVHPAVRKGSRKEHFVAEKDAWKVVQCITRERRRREVEPALEVLDRCLTRTKGLRTAEARAFRAQLTELREFAGLADRMMERIARGRSRSVLPWVLKFLG